MKRFLMFGLLAVLLAAPLHGQETGFSNNFFGTHLIIDNLDERGLAQFQWTRNLVGQHGYVKTFFFGITKNTQGAPQSWRDVVQHAYDLDMIPHVRLGGVHVASQGYWLKPEADPDGRYHSIAQAVKRVVEDLPRSDKYPLYIQVWNEPNLAVEWSGEVNLKEYAHFFVDVSKAIRSIGDDRIRITNGAFALSPEATEKCILADPEFIDAFDVWAAHCYPQNYPPEYNNHDGTAVHPEATIDGYLLELKVLERYGRKDVQVIIAEGGYNLGNSVYGNLPPINEYNRADYIMRAFRDYYPRFRNLIAVFPFLFSDPGWIQHNWVHVDSGTDENGLPTKPHYQYTAVQQLARVTDSTGAISGKVMDNEFGVPLQGATVSIKETKYTTQTDPMGNYFAPTLEPGEYTLTVDIDGFRTDAAISTYVLPGKNNTVNFRLPKTQTGTIAGTLLNGSTGQPLAGVSVTLQPGDQTATTAANGTFSFSDLAAIPWTLTASQDGFTTHILEDLKVNPEEETRAAMRIAEDPSLQWWQMLKNPSMERVSDPVTGKGDVLGWEPLVGGPFEPSDEEARTGLRSLKLNASGGHFSHRQISHYFTVTPGREYIGGLWMKTRGVVPAGPEGGAWVNMVFTDNSGKPISEVTAREVTGDSEWTYFELKGIAPEGSQRLSLEAHLQATAGAAYFDDGYMAEVGKLTEEDEEE